MRLKLTLSHPADSSIPINYSYLISAMIYRKLESANPTFSAWLHEHGWEANKRQYKLFTFSRLSPTFFKVSGDRLILRESPSYLTLSFHVSEIMEHFVQGLFQEQKFSLGDRRSQTDFEVVSVDILPKIVCSEKMKFKLGTPLVVSYQGDQDRYAQYLHPIDNQPEYSSLFFANLLRKYIAFHGSIDNSMDLRPNDSHLRVLTKPGSKLLSIKSGTNQATKIRGYIYGFEIIGAPALIEMGYYAGFGEKGSMGFGFAELW